MRLFTWWRRHNTELESVREEYERSQREAQRLLREQMDKNRRLAIIEAKLRARER